MKLSKPSIGIVLTALALMCTSAQGQRMYRCGNQYQDTPCGGGQQGKSVNTSGAGKSVAASTASDPECAARGAASQKISWAREGGATLEKQMADLRAKGQDGDAAQVNLITAVYYKRGTAPEVRTAIEADCAAEKDRAAQAAALRLAAEKLEGKGANASTAAPAASGTASKSGAEGSLAVTQASGSGSVVGDTSAKKTECDSLSRQVEGVRNNQRAGGNSAQMESMNNQRRALEAKQRTAGC